MAVPATLEIFIYEPTLTTDTFQGALVIRDIDQFTTPLQRHHRQSSPREPANLAGDKVYSRDIFSRD